MIVLTGILHSNFAHCISIALLPWANRTCCSTMLLLLLLLLYQQVVAVARHSWDAQLPEAAAWMVAVTTDCSCLSTIQLLWRLLVVLSNSSNTGLNDGWRGWRGKPLIISRCWTC